MSAPPRISEEGISTALSQSNPLESPENRIERGGDEEERELDRNDPEGKAGVGLLLDRNHEQAEEERFEREDDRDRGRADQYQDGEAAADGLVERNAVAIRMMESDMAPDRPASAEIEQAEVAGQRTEDDPDPYVDSPSL